MIPPIPRGGWLAWVVKELWVKRASKAAWVFRR
jgi:hypothetical protein